MSVLYSSKFMLWEGSRPILEQIYNSLPIGFYLVWSASVFYAWLIRNCDERLRSEEGKH